VAISSADAAAVAAASTREPTTAAVAKALAGRAAAVAARNCLQVFGGIGFTVEHEFHRYFRRNLVLDRLLGNQRALEREVGSLLRRGALRRERVVELDDEPRLELLMTP
jgi:alkylation response protein AidB-like acyl-CoA dehydrogenase